ncbi:cytochrome o ubiquinol oxidase subunit IV [Gluconacetobacter tumulicola]|uniref:Cytochrome bo(3) ubiquinol oxidase subunit 4 n=1 Tax=Gluconacetobacter tumulicola TaxID=1017177 RepID=A0A7W4JCG4_9PROT|nr:cytochrome o ubiquinol oxidase subunit IV [Gluconacetobacter tumulicola]MBB2178653.1 cytochrome o ubiquinol oxidase subunit IV [Gluconacetobacter tumulicola]
MHKDVSPTEGHGLRHCVVGLALSLLLTALAFWAVMGHALPHELIMPAVVFFGVIQLLVQLYYFLHLGLSPEQRENTAYLILAVMLITVIVGLSLWVMHNADVSMMPGSMSTMDAVHHE